MIDVNIKDTLTLSDGNSYVVVSKAIHKDNIYYYLIDNANNENVKFCVENSMNFSLVEIEDKKLIYTLLPLFLKSSAKAITKEDLKLLEQDIS